MSLSSDRLGPWQRSDRTFALRDSRVSTADDGPAVVLERVVDPYGATPDHYEASVTDGYRSGAAVRFDDAPAAWEWHVATSRSNRDVLLLVPGDGQTVLRADLAALTVDVVHRLSRQAHPGFLHVELFLHRELALVVTESTLTVLDLDRGEVRQEVVVGDWLEQWRPIRLTADAVQFGSGGQLQTILLAPAPPAST